MPMSRVTRLLSVIAFVATLFFAIIIQYVTRLQLNTLKDPQSHHIGPIIGIELGRSYDSVATFRNNTFEIIVDSQGRSKIPSYVGYPEQAAPVVGFEAKLQADDNPKNTIYDLSILLGRVWSDPELRSNIKTLPYDVVTFASEPLIKIYVNETELYFTLGMVLSHQLEHLKTMAEVQLNQTVNSAIISVPNYFNETQRHAVRGAAEIAGLDIHYFISQSVAAGLAYDIDTMVTKRNKGEDDTPDYFLTYNLGEKESSMAVESVIRGVFQTIGLANDIESGLSNDEDKIRSKIITLIKKVLEAAQIDQSDIKAIVLAGDSVQTEKAQPVLESFFSGRKVLQKKEVRSDEAIVYGAALQAHRISEDYDGVFPQLMDVLPLSLGIETHGGIFSKVISQDTVIPTRKTCIVTTVTDDQDKVVIKIFGGERSIANTNQFLGMIELDGFSKRPKAEVEIEVQFEVDADGVLTVVAIEKESKREAKVIIPIDLDPYTVDEVNSIVIKGELSEDEDPALVKQLLTRAQDSSEDRAFGVVIK